MTLLSDRKNIHIPKLCPVCNDALQHIVTETIVYEEYFCKTCKECWDYDQAGNLIDVQLFKIVTFCKDIPIKLRDNRVNHHRKNLIKVRISWIASDE
ncbi:unnamed protein product [marine sediment metagenome]|uniref:Uncharacterized protein n=1 Tax=marine sediment metagenome TaxID=412755 RepID=X1J626_9ZZZZ